MRTIDEYMKLPYRLEVIEDPIEGGYVATYPDLKGCITYADTAEKLIEMARDAKRAWLEAAIDSGYEIPEPSSDETYSGQFKLRIPKSLHRQLSEGAKREGISMNQYCLYLLTKYDTAYAPEARNQKYRLQKSTI
ncbi:MAG: toxin-antitoxin system HicB family antitoxin [Eubacteriales bacterium]